MTEFFEQTFYGNTVLQWTISLTIVLGAFVIGKALYWTTSVLMRRVTARTRTKIDDILLDMIEEPLVVAATVAGIWVGFKRLALSPPVENAMDRVLHVVVVVCVVWLVSRLFDSLFKEYLAPLAEKTETDLDDQLLPIVKKGTKILIWSIGFVVALNNAGYDVGALIAGLGIGGLALAMAAQDTVANIFGGFTIFTDRPFTINDRIKIAGYDGTIQEIGVRSTRLKTLEGRIVTIPNRKFSDSAVENVSLEPSRKVVLQLGLTYDTTPEQMRRAMAILREISEQQDGHEDEVILGFSAFGDSAMMITFIYYITKGADIMQTNSETNLAILERFNAEGLEFAFPTQTIYHQAMAAA